MTKTDSLGDELLHLPRESRALLAEKLPEAWTARRASD